MNSVNAPEVQQTVALLASTQMRCKEELEKLLAWQVEEYYSVGGPVKLVLVHMNPKKLLTEEREHDEILVSRPDWKRPQILQHLHNLITW